MRNHKTAISLTLIGLFAANIAFVSKTQSLLSTM
jgi:hypothetical protein